MPWLCRWQDPCAYPHPNPQGAQALGNTGQKVMTPPEKCHSASSQHTRDTQTAAASVQRIRDSKQSHAFFLPSLPSSKAHLTHLHADGLASLAVQQAATALDSHRCVMAYLLPTTAVPWVKSE